MLLCSLLLGMFTGNSEAVMTAMLSGAAEAVELCLSMAGSFMLWMGLMNIAKAGGMIESLSRLLEPLLKGLFPQAREAVAAITMNLTANLFGMGAAATPFGLAAMAEMEKKNRRPGVATDEMCMFIALNASAVELIPTGVIALRTAAGSAEPYAVVLPAFLASLLSALTAVCCCLVGRRRQLWR